MDTTEMTTGAGRTVKVAATFVPHAERRGWTVTADVPLSEGDDPPPETEALPADHEPADHEPFDGDRIFQHD